MNTLEKVLEEIKILKRKQNSANQDFKTGYISALSTIEGFIAGMDNGWIPITERLPEEDERYEGRKVIRVLVTTRSGNVTKVQRQLHKDSWYWGRIYDEPKAWMPLPEAYKEG